jgi:hypothetical protein
MKAVRDKCFLRIAGVGLAILFSASVFAQSAETDFSANDLSTNEDSAAQSTGILKSPVYYFRELLTMTPPDRKDALTNRPPEIQKRILAKIREYESLKPDERELRLRVTELRWYLLPLMNGSRTNRAAMLARIPAEQRKEVEARLQNWDILPPSFQQELLNSELSSRYFAQLETARTAEQRERILSRLSPERRAKLEAGIDDWRAMSPDMRQKTLNGFNRFFELTPEEKQQALQNFPESERRQMEKTLASYSKLPAMQREQCIRYFQKFTSMTIAERQQFLKNAERWRLMSAADREKWRNLVESAPLLPSLDAPFSPDVHPTRIPVATN